MRALERWLTPSEQHLEGSAVSSVSYPPPTWTRNIEPRCSSNQRTLKDRKQCAKTYLFGGPGSIQENCFKLSREKSYDPSHNPKFFFFVIVDKH